MKRVDFHRLSIEEMEIKVDLIVGSIRLMGVSENYELITGEGVLKEHLKNYLKERYEINYREAHNCSGTINVTME